MNVAGLMHLAIGFVTAGLAVPLILRRIPMNYIYGVRIEKAFSSDANWYDINAYGGKLLLRYGLVLMAIGALILAAGPRPDNVWTLVLIIVPLVPLFVVLGMILAYAKRLP